MPETPLFFKNGNYSLFAVLHEPEQAGPGDLGFVFCSPFAEEKLWAHRVFVSFARELSELGYPVLRFDYMGTGDSDGDFEQSTALTNISDIRAAAGYLLKNSSARRICLVGLCLGATLACLAAEEEPSVCALALWNPVIKAGAYMQEFLKMNLTTQLALYKEIKMTRNDLVKLMDEGKTVNVDGYEISKELYSQISDIDLLKGEKRFSGKVLIAQVNRKEGPLGKPFEELASLYRNASSAVAVEEPFWKEIKTYYPKAKNLSRVTLEWLREI